MKSIVLSLVLMFIVVGSALAADNCPLKLQESQTQSAIIAQSRDATEQRLAQAIRANQELGSLYDKADAELKKLKEQLAALQPKPAEKSDEKKDEAK